jgi:hypothetical protein
MGEEAILEARGGMLVGADAVGAGLADGVATLESLIEAVSAPEFEVSYMNYANPLGVVTATGTGTVSLAAGGLHIHTEEATMDNQVNPAAEAPVIDRAFLDANYPDLVESIKSDGASKERERILEIHALEGAGFENLKTDFMSRPDGTKGDAAAAILSAKGEQEKRQKVAAKEAVEADEAALATVAAVSIPGSQDESEEAVAASVVSHIRTLQGAPKEN